MERKKKKKLLRQIRREATTAPADRLVSRDATFRAETANDASRTIEVVIASENPIPRMDMERGQVFDEVLLMDGVQFRGERSQLPIVDSHNATTVRNVYGSVRNIRRDGDELIGDAHFASDKESQDAYNKVKEGHLTDFSITATPLEIHRIEPGESAVVGGVNRSGPSDFVTRWKPSNASLVATGADERSTVRGSLLRGYDFQTPINSTEPDMNEQLRLALIAQGMPADLTDEQAVAWVSERNLNPESPDAPPPEPVTALEPEPVLADRSANTDADLQRTAAVTQERQRVTAIRELCRSASASVEIETRLIERGSSIDVARAEILSDMLDRNPPVGTTATRTDVNVVGEGRQRLHDAIRDGLVMRAYGAANLRTDAFGEGGPAQGAADFRNLTMLRLGERCLVERGIDTSRMTNRDIAMVAMGHRPTIERLQIERAAPAYHTTGSFASILLDAANKTLLGGYNEAPYTWSVWARQASSVADFKAINRVRFSESPDLQNVPENDTYPEGKMSDEKESYKVEKFGRLFTVSWETVVNDDLDAISRVPAMHGNAARRTQNKKVYEVLTANADMADGTALFAAGHNNIDASGAAPNVAQLNSGFTKMRTQTGVNSSVTIDVTPRYLIVPVALEATAMQLINSIADPNVGGSAAGNSNTANIYGPGGPRNLTVVADPVLDGNSTALWYLAADPSQIDTVELSFLQGEESPVLESEFNFDNDTWKYKIRQTFGVKSIDWRGVYRNAGA